MATDQTADGAAVLEHRLGHDHAVPTAEDRERGERARRELAALGAEVWATTYWWGFAIHLNAQAADITELIGDVAGTILPSPFNKIVEALAKLKTVLIKAVSAGYGCRLVSPWFAPGMLIPISKAPDNDIGLWWTVFQEGQDWSEDQRYPAHTSEHDPALAVLGNTLWAIHCGGGSDKSLWQIFVSKVRNHYLWCGVVPSGFPGRFTALPWALGGLRCLVDRAGDRGGAVAFTAG